MSMIVMTHGKEPSRHTMSLEGDTVGYKLDQPAKGLTTIWANSPGKDLTFWVPSDTILSVNMEKIGSARD